MKRPWLLVPWLMLVLLLLFWAAVYHWSGTGCKERGGHLEWVYGSGAGWVCIGAQK